MEIWDKLSDEQKYWYRDFVRGTKYGDKKALERIFVNIPEDIQRRIMVELHYEWHSRQRNTYTIPKSRFPKHNEFDYGWIHTKPVSVRKEIEFDYNGETQQKGKFSRTNEGRATRRKRK
jgi:hypothetical protein